MKRVQIYIVDEEITETWNESVDVTRAIDTLNKFKDVVEGIEPLPPKKWKCNNCAFKKECKYGNNNRDLTKVDGKKNIIRLDEWI